MFGDPSGMAPEKHKGGRGLTGATNNNGKVKHSLLDVKGMFDLSSVSSIYAAKITSSIENIYKGDPSYFDDLWEGGNTQPVKVKVETARQIAQRYGMQAKAQKMGVKGIGGAGGIIRSTGQPCLFIAEEYFTDNFSQYDAFTADYLEKYKNIDGKKSKYTIAGVLAHEVTHIMDRLRLGNIAYAQLDENEQESLAVEGANYVRKILNLPLKKNSFYRIDKWIIWGSIIGTIGAIVYKILSKP